MSSKTIEASLAECESLLSRNQHANAESILAEVINHANPDDLRRLQAVFNEIIGRFFEKRRRSLIGSYNQRLDGVTPVPLPESSSQSGHRHRLSDAAIDQFEAEVQRTYSRLSNYHIFQWTNYYIDEFRHITNNVITLVRGTTNDDRLYDALLRLTIDHSAEIFSKGYRNASSQPTIGIVGAEGKALAGLRSFLEIPIEIYADEAARLHSSSDCRAIRKAISKIIAGIVLGFTEAQLGVTPPRDLLTRTVKSWAHLLPLLEESDLAAVASALGTGSDTDRFIESLKFVCRALDLAARESSVDPVVIVSTNANLELGVIDVAIRAPIDSSDTKPLEISLIFADQARGKSLIETKQKHGVTACVTNLPARAYWNGKFVPRPIDEIVVPVAECENARFLLDRMRQRFHENKIVVKQGVPLRTNVAERFPLENPRMLSFYRVSRASIRTLETMIATRTGVLLWCSVRRSGKTTGVSDLAKSVKDRSVVFQRCEMTGGDAESRILFERVCDVLRVKEELPRDFVRNLVAKASPMGSGQEHGSILILDEYDRLFGRLRSAGRRDEDTRHLVVQPLLDQLVEFATDNLVILLGQQPNAHYIFMDQNQLSAYVQQEPYPLFSHEPLSTTGEFWELVGKVFQNALRYDPSFVDAVFRETSGHPYLTVNLLRDFVDLLIEKRVVPSETLLTSADFESFASIRLTRRAIAGSRFYEFFRAAASESLSPDAASETPWIHVAYKLLYFVGTTGAGAELRCDLSTINALVGKTLADCGLYSSTVDSFLSSAAYGNFITVESEGVSPRIPLLARIAASARIELRDVS
jgi:hypothetical protein